MDASRAIVPTSKSTGRKLLSKTVGIEWLLDRWLSRVNKIRGKTYTHKSVKSKSQGASARNGNAPSPTSAETIELRQENAQLKARVQALMADQHESMAELSRLRDGDTRPVRGARTSVVVAECEVARVKAAEAEQREREAQAAAEAVRRVATPRIQNVI